MTRPSSSTSRHAERGSLGGVYGALFAVIVVVSAVSATVAVPTDLSQPDRPHTDIDTLSDGIDREVRDTNRAVTNEDADTPGAARSVDPPPPTAILAAQALDDLPARTRASLSARLEPYLERLRASRATDGTVTRLAPAGDGIVGGATITRAGSQHTVTETVREPYTVNRRILARYRRAVARYQTDWAPDAPGPDWTATGATRSVEVAHESTWAVSRPGPGWTKTNASRDRVIDTEYEWATRPPGDGWVPTGTRRRLRIDTETTWATAAPGPDWQRTGRQRTRVVRSRTVTRTTSPGPSWIQRNQVGTERIRTGTAHRHLWTADRHGTSIYAGLLGYTHAGIVATTRVQTGTESVTRWGASKRTRDRKLLRNGFTYAGIRRSNRVQTGQKTTWRWQHRGSPGRKWQKQLRVKLFRGYRKTVSRHRPGRNWRRAGVHHVRTRKTVRYQTKRFWGWHDIYRTVPHIHYRTKRTWIPGRTEVVQTRTWVPGQYTTVTTREWVGWKRVTKRTWVSGYWTTKRVRKTVTRWKRSCHWKWSWRTGFYKTCSRKKVTSYKTVTRKKWVSGRWKRRTAYTWVGWTTVRTKRWVPGHYETTTHRTFIRGHWKTERIRTGIHHHRVRDRVWGPYTKRVKVITTRPIKYYRWKKPIYRWKVKWARPTYSVRYQHRYTRPTYERRYKHHYTKPLYTTRPVYRWTRRSTRTEREYARPIYAWETRYARPVTVREHRWRKPVLGTERQWRRPVYRRVPVYRTETETKYRTRTRTYAVAAAPLTYRGRGNWTLGTGITRVRNATLTIERPSLTATPARPLELRATGDRSGGWWRLAVWREGDAIVLDSGGGPTHRVRGATRATIDFDARTVNDRPAGITLAPGFDEPYTLSVRRGGTARGSFTLTHDGRTPLRSRPGNPAADVGGLTVHDNIVYSATFDVTIRTDRTVYTDRITIRPGPVGRENGRP